MDESARQVPVLIIGGGPVGMTLAMELAKHNVQSLLVEQRHSLSPLPRATFVNPRSMQIYRRLGVANNIRKAGLPLGYGNDFIFKTYMFGSEIYRFRNPTAAHFRGLYAKMRIGQKVNVSASLRRKVNLICEGSSELGQRISQNTLEPVLKTEAQGHRQIEMRFGWQFLGHDQSESGVVSQIRNLDTGETVEVRSDYLVGCDGAKSGVRRDLGIAMTGEQHTARMFSVYFNAPNLAKLISPPNGFAQVYLINSKQNAVLLTHGNDHYTLHFVLERDSVAEARSPAGWVRLVAGGNVKFDVTGTSHWRVNMLVANRFRAERVFLAGDAAHLIPPTGGFGMNIGIQDAQGLGWKLAACINGWGGPKVLDSYDGDRREAVMRYRDESVAILEQTIGQTDAIPSIVESRGILGTIVRFFVAQIIKIKQRKHVDFLESVFDYRYKDSILNFKSTKGTAAVQSTKVKKVKAGDLAPHKWLDEQTSLYDKFGFSYTLLCLESVESPDVQALVKSAKSYGMPLNVVTCDRADVQALYGWRMVLIRPDYHISWCGEKLPDEPELLIRRACGWGSEGRRPQGMATPSSIAG